MSPSPLIKRLHAKLTQSLFSSLERPWNYGSSLRSSFWMDEQHKKTLNDDTTRLGAVGGTRMLLDRLKTTMSLIWVQPEEAAKTRLLFSKRGDRENTRGRARGRGRDRESKNGKEWKTERGGRQQTDGRPTQRHTPAAPTRPRRTRCSGPAYAPRGPDAADAPPSGSWRDCWCPSNGSQRGRARWERADGTREKEPRWLLWQIRHHRHEGERMRERKRLVWIWSILPRISVFLYISVLFIL